MIRCAERNLHYERAWRELETGQTGIGSTPDQLTHRQIVALAGEFYCEMVVRHSDDPGRPIEAATPKFKNPPETRHEDQ